MKQNISCISIYSNADASRQAINLLQATGCELQDINIIARQKCCDKVDMLFDDSKIFEITGFGALIFSGKRLSQVISEYKKLSADNHLNLAGNSQINTQRNELETALFNIGVTAGYISEYVQAIKNNKILLLVYGTQQNVEQACEVLLNETQQVTVHRA